MSAPSTVASPTAKVWGTHPWCWTGCGERRAQHRGTRLREVRGVDLLQRRGEGCQMQRRDSQWAHLMHTGGTRT